VQPHGRTRSGRPGAHPTPGRGVPTQPRPRLSRARRQRVTRSTSSVGTSVPRRKGSSPARIPPRPPSGQTPLQREDSGPGRSGADELNARRPRPFVDRGKGCLFLKGKGGDRHAVRLQRSQFSRASARKGSDRSREWPGVRFDFQVPKGATSLQDNRNNSLASTSRADRAPGPRPIANRFDRRLTRSRVRSPRSPHGPRPGRSEIGTSIVNSRAGWIRVPSGLV
jgi:hypothetical protein